MAKTVKDTIEIVELEKILIHLSETIGVCDYPTPSMFSAITRLSIISFLNGRGHTKNTEALSVDVFKQLVELSKSHSKYKWFDEWAKRLVESINERKMEE